MSRLRFCQLSSSRFTALFLSGVVCLSGSAMGQSPTKHAAPLPKTAAPKISGRAIPLVFEENAGQLPQGTAFAGRTQDYTVQIRPSELQFGLPGKKTARTVTLSFTGSKGAKPEGVTDAGFRTNFYIGNDRSKWHTGVRNFDRVALRQLYPGVDAEFYSHSNEIEHDFMLAPRADASQLAMHLAGAKSATLSQDGDLVLAAEEGALRLHKPNAYQVQADGSRKLIDASFELARNGDSADLHFKLGAYDHDRALVIDPVITYATYVTGDKGSTPTSIQSDASGNVYLTGTTLSSSTNFSVTSPQLNPSSGLTDPPTSAVTFVARLSASDSGSKIAWLTYYGSTTASVNAGPSAFNGTTLVVGGNTTALDLPVSTTTPGAPFQVAPVMTTGGTSFGFLASFNTSGALGATAYLDGSNSPNATDVTTVGAITLDATGNVTVVGTTNATGFPTSTASATTLPLEYNGLDTAIGTATQSKGFVATLDPTLVTESYGTYFTGPNGAASDPAQGPETALTGVALDSTGNIYVAGMTYGAVLQAGLYNDAVAASPNSSANGDVSGTTRDVFAASITPASQTVNWSYSAPGAGDDVVNGASFDSNNNLLLYGKTGSSTFLSSAVFYSYIGVPVTLPLPDVPLTHFDSNYPANATAAGWVVLLNNLGIATSSTFVGGDGTVALPSVTSVTGAKTGTVQTSSPSQVAYLTGTTNVARAGFPANDLNIVSSTYLGLPSNQNNPSDSSDTNPTRSFLLQMDGALGGVNYLTSLGSQNGNPLSVGLALDAPPASPPDAAPGAFVAISDTPNPAQVYTTSSAAERAPQVVNGSASSAYVARVAYLNGGNINSLAAAPISGGNITPTVYGSTVSGSTVTASSTLSITFEVQVAAAVNNFVFDLPQSPYISNYSASSFTFTVGGTDMKSTCTLGTAVATTAASPALPVNATPGITCVVPHVAAGNVDLVLSGETLTAAATAGATLSLTATAYDDTGSSVDASVPLTPAGVPTFTVSNTVNGSTSAATVNAALSTTDTTTPTTAVSYVYGITNTSAFDSPQTVLTTNLDTSKISGGSPTITAVYSGPTTPYPTCTDPTTGTGCDIPTLDTLTYTVAGVYLGSQFGASATGPFTVSTAAPTIAYVPVISPVPTPPVTNALTVTVNGNAQIAQTSITTSAATYNGGFQLGDSNVQLIATVTNTGSNAAPYAGSITLPHGFVASGTNISTGSGTANCPATPAATCTFSFNAISGGSSGNTAVLTITGGYQDTGTSADAVPALTTNPTPTPATVSGQTVTGSSTASFSTTAAGSNPYYPAVTTATQSATINVFRVNLLTSAVNATAPLATNTVNAYSRLPHPAPAPGTYNDTVSYQVTVSNSGTSGLRGLYTTIPVISASVPSAAVTMTSGPTPSDNSMATGLTCSYTAPNITCYQNDLTNTTSTTMPSSYTISYTLAYDQSLIPTTTGTKNVTLAAQSADMFLAASDVAGTAGADYKTTATAGATPTQQITVQRLASLNNALAYSTVNAVAPTTLADTTRLNLDEHIAGDAHGKNDTIIVRSSTTNSGPNDADKVTINVPLPAFMRVAVPAGCTLTVGGSSTGPTGNGPLVSTGTGGTMTCTPTTYADTTPLGNAETDTTAGMLNASTSACSLSLAVTDATFSNSGYDAGHACFQVAFYAKFADTAAETNTVAGTNPFGAVAYTAATLTDNDVQGATPVATLSTATTPLITSVQRAAHVRLSAAVFPAAIPAPVYTDGSALTIDKTLTPNLPEIGQAANLYNVTTHVATGGKVYDCFRYQVAVVNDGPNYTNSTAMHYAFSGGAYVPAGNSTSPGNTSPVNCAVSNTSPANTAPVGPLQPGGGITVSLDGYFDIGSLNNVNSSQTTFSTTPFTIADAQDSNAPADVTSNPSADFRGTQSLTLVNTPFNNANTAGIGITPVSTSAKANLIFTSVTQAGITNAISTTSITCTSTSSLNNCFPSGKSPYPPDSGAVRNLYQPGKTPTYYQVLTTAVAPQTAPSATTNPTSICLTPTSGGAFPDVFVKPERVLLWVLKNPATGTTYNSFPSGFPAFTSTSSLVGDVTTSVVPYLVSSYQIKPATPTFPQLPQAQPGSVCGTVNGMTTTPTVDSTSASAAETFGLLEPVNFPPYVVAGVVASSASTGKGSTSGVEDVYIAVTGTTAASGFTYDYNDRDPCYIASATTKRQSCDDNPYLATRMFISGGGTAMTLLNNLGPETSTSLPGGTVGKQLSVIYATAGTGLFVAVADQATGADAYNTDIATAPGYSSNPFGHQGNFLLAPFSLSSATGGASVCDPGTLAFSGYTLSSTACAGGVSATSSQRYVSGGQQTAGGAITYGAAPGTGGNDYYLGTVGAQGIAATISGTGSGLLPLPFPDGTTPPTSTSPLPRNPGDTTGTTPLGPTASPTAAIANISAGQTAGFIWPWLASQTTALGVTAGGAPGDLYDLSCSAYDVATQQQPTSLPAGMSCYISTTTTSNPSASPTVYTFGASSPPTIYISTNGNLFAKADPLWKRGLEGIVLAMVLPVFFFRRRLGKGATVMLLFLALAAAPLLSGCGAGGPASGTSSSGGTVTPSGSYYLRVIAKPEKSGKANITSAVFEVVVQSGS